LQVLQKNKFIINTVLAIERSGKVVPVLKHHAMNMYGGVEVQLPILDLETTFR
jgi:hypothetical protein